MSTENFDPLQSADLLGKISGKSYMDKLGDNDSRTKMAAYIGKAFDAIIYEEGFARKVLAFKQAEDTEKVFDPKTNQEYVLVPLGTDAGNFIESNFESKATVMKVSQEWAELRFGKLEGVTLEFEERELDALNSRPFIEAKEKIPVKMSEIEDKLMIDSLNAAVELTGKVIDATGDANFTSSHFVKAKNYIDADRLVADKMITTKTFMNDLYLWDRNVLGGKKTDERWDSDISLTQEFGSLKRVASIKEELFVTIFYRTAGQGTVMPTLGWATTTDMNEAETVEKNGLKYPIIVKKVRHMFMVTDDEHLGRARDLKPLTVWDKKEGSVVSLGAYRYEGLLIFSRGISRLDLGMEF